MGFFSSKPTVRADDNVRATPQYKQAYVEEVARLDAAEDRKRQAAEQAEAFRNSPEGRRQAEKEYLADNEYWRQLQRANDGPCRD